MGRSKRNPPAPKTENKENESSSDADSPVFAKPAPKRRRAPAPKTENKENESSDTDDSSSKSSDTTRRSDDRRNEKKKQSDAQLVADVKAFMKANKLGQVQVGREARISQAVISQWLSLKYHGHNDKVDAAMRTWLDARQAGEVVHVAQAGQPTSVLRPMQRPSVRKSQQAAAAAAKETAARAEVPDKNSLSKEELAEMTRFQNEAATDGAMFREHLENELMEMKTRPPSLSDALGDVGKRTPKMLRHGGKLDPSMPSPFGHIMSPGQFAPVGITGSSQTPVGLPTPGRSPYNATAPQPFWAGGIGGRTPGTWSEQVQPRSPMNSMRSPMGKSCLAPVRSPITARSPTSISGGSPFIQPFVFKMDSETPIDPSSRLSIGSTSSVVGVSPGFNMSSPDSPGDELARRSPRFAKKLLWTPGNNYMDSPALGANHGSPSTALGAAASHEYTRDDLAEVKFNLHNHMSPLHKGGMLETAMHGSSPSMTADRALTAE